MFTSTGPILELGKKYTKLTVTNTHNIFTSTEPMLGLAQNKVNRN